MQSITKKAIAGLIVAGTVGFGSAAFAADPVGCASRLVTAESATVNNYGPSVSGPYPVATVDFGNPPRVVADTGLNAAYFLDCAAL